MLTEQQTIFLPKAVFLTTLALIAFAANSVVCRYALEDGELDAASFTILRLFSGIIMLIVVMTLTRSQHLKQGSLKGGWFAALMLFLYASCFSFAYTSVGAGIGALILFGAVQITMLFISLQRGHKLHISEWFGVAVASIGFVYLVLPDEFAPPLSGVFLMLISGVAWAFYTLNGQRSSDALLDTTFNFIKTLPFIILLGLFSFQSAHFSMQGVILAIFSGAITSALGYVIWYHAIQYLRPVQAAVSQLVVPVIATIGGALLLSEVITHRITIASLMILGGIGLVSLGRYYLAKD
jgi:drug/metabolite transporter (DMT)-like permease